MVRSGETDYAVVPIENSVEGGINATLDALALDSNLMIVAEVLVPIAFTLAARPGTKLEDIERIATHDAAWTQCRNWLTTNLPNAMHLSVNSTATGAAGLASGEAVDYQATLVSELAAAQYELEPLAQNIADNPDAVTRFVMISRFGKIPERTGSDKTTLMVQLPHNKSGALMDMLEQFAVRGVNLSRIESRPTGDALGRYAFSIDAEGHLFDERIQAILLGLHRVCPKVTFLGSYPTAQTRPVTPEPGNTDEDFQQARSWVKYLIERAQHN